MAGQGSRLGMPFHKALAPTFTPDGIRPLYWHAYRQLRDARVDEVRFVLPPCGGDEDPCLTSLYGLGRVLEKQPERGELPSTLAFAARDLHPDDLCVVALPDGIITSPRLVARLIATHDAIEARRPVDGTLALFRGPANVLDEVVVDAAGNARDIVPHGDDDRTEVWGWGCFVANAGVLKGLDDSRRLGAQLAEYAFAGRHLGGRYYDLGTPARYRAHINVLETA